MSAEGIIAAIEGMKDRPDRRDFLARTNIPVLFILGKKDLKIPFNKTVEQISLPNDSEALILGNVGHMGFIEAKEETQIAIRCFAEKVL
jgi:pimeloyl-ACP methyl ester carboxylesterase